MTSTATAPAMTNAWPVYSPRRWMSRSRSSFLPTLFGETVGQAFVVIGAVGAMLLALFEFEYFWIANVIYLCFILSAILSSIARIVAYRSGMPRW